MAPHSLLHQGVALLAWTTLFLAAGCASMTEPVLYPMAQAAPGARPQAQTDLQACRQAADNAVGARHAPQAAAGMARKGAAEFADQAVDSLVVGSKDAWRKARGAAAGAMAGNLVGSVLTWNEPDGVYRRYVELCMKDRGHTVLGWR